MVCGRGFDSRRLHQIPVKAGRNAGLFYCLEGLSTMAGIFLTDVPQFENRATWKKQ